MKRLASFALAAALALAAFIAPAQVVTVPAITGFATGNGSVTSAACSPAEGVTCTVSTATSTPTFAIGLGAISPASLTIGGVTSTGATGTGTLVFSSSPALSTPNLGTPTALTLTSATGLPVSTGVSGLAAGVAAFLGTPTSANLATAVTDETGTGALVFGTSPTFTTSLVTPLVRSTAAKVLIQGTGTGATQLAATQTTVPTCSTNCGTSPSVVGTDTAGVVTMGASGTPASGWVVTFNGTWAAAPACVVQSALASMVVGKMPIAVVTATTTMTVTTNGTAPSASDKYQFHCVGTQ